MSVVGESGRVCGTAYCLRACGDKTKRVVGKSGCCTSEHDGGTKPANTVRAGIVSIGYFRSHTTSVVFCKSSIDVVVGEIDCLTLGINSRSKVACIVVCIDPRAVRPICRIVQIFRRESPTETVICESTDVAIGVSGCGKIIYCVICIQSGVVVYPLVLHYLGEIPICVMSKVFVVAFWIRNGSYPLIVSVRGSTDGGTDCRNAL